MKYFSIFLSSEWGALQSAIACVGKLHCVQSFCLSSNEMTYSVVANADSLRILFTKFSSFTMMYAVFVQMLFLAFGMVYVLPFKSLMICFKSSNKQLLESPKSLYPWEVRFLYSIWSVLTGKILMLKFSIIMDHLLSKKKFTADLSLNSIKMDLYCKARSAKLLLCGPLG